MSFLDQGAGALLAEARDFYRRAHLDTVQLFQRGNEAVLLTWRGDGEDDGLAMLLASIGLTATNEGIYLTMPGVTTDRLLDALAEIAGMTDLDPVVMLADAKNIMREKWDWAMPDGVLRRSFASLHLDLVEARRTADALCNVATTAQNADTIEGATQHEWLRRNSKWIIDQPNGISSGDVITDRQQSGDS